MDQDRIEGWDYQCIDLSEARRLEILDSGRINLVFLKTGEIRQKYEELISGDPAAVSIVSLLEVDLAEQDPIMECSIAFWVNKNEHVKPYKDGAICRDCGEWHLWEFMSKGICDICSHKRCAACKKIIEGEPQVCEICGQGFCESDFEQTECSECESHDIPF